jgi:hypothetical protein
LVMRCDGLLLLPFRGEGRPVDPMRKIDKYYWFPGHPKYLIKYELLKQVSH